MLCSGARQREHRRLRSIQAAQLGSRGDTAPGNAAPEQSSVVSQCRRAWNCSSNPSRVSTRSGGHMMPALQQRPGGCACARLGGRQRKPRSVAVVAGSGLTCRSGGPGAGRWQPSAAQTPARWPGRRDPAAPHPRWACWRRLRRRWQQPGALPRPGLGRRSGRPAQRWRHAAPGPPLSSSPPRRCRL